jgi:hypothetical protein
MHASARPEKEDSMLRPESDTSEKCVACMPATDKGFDRVRIGIRERGE